MSYIINELTCANCQTRLSDLYISLGHPEEKIVYHWKCPVCGAENERVAFPFDTLLQGNIPHWEHGGATPTPFKPRSVAEEMQTCAVYFNMEGAVSDKKTMLDLFNDLFDACKDISIDRLRELATADAEGRVVVLPKSGDKLYYAPYPEGAKDQDGNLMFLRNTGDGSGEVRRVDVLVTFDNWMGRVSINRTWKTLAEAARALSEASAADAGKGE